jgi:hypothetical protein
MTQTVYILRNGAAGFRPDPAILAEGRIALNYNNEEPGLYFSDSLGGLVKVGPCHIGELPPNSGAAPPEYTELSVGEFWFDTVSGLLKVWDGTAWIYSENTGPASTPQFGGLGLGVPPATGWILTQNGATVVNRVVVTPATGTYTLDVLLGSEFQTSSAINGATTVNLDNLGEIPAGYLWKGVLTFSYTSGAISWFTGNTGYSVVWTGGSALTPVASASHKVLIEIVGGTSVIEATTLG